MYLVRRVSLSSVIPPSFHPCPTPYSSKLPCSSLMSPRPPSIYPAPLVTSLAVRRGSPPPHPPLLPGCPASHPRCMSNLIKSNIYITTGVSGVFLRLISVFFFFVPARWGGVSPPHVDKRQGYQWRWTVVLLPGPSVQRVRGRALWVIWREKARLCR